MDSMTLNTARTCIIALVSGGNGGSVLVIIAVNNNVYIAVDARRLHELIHPQENAPWHMPPIHGTRINLEEMVLNDSAPPHIFLPEIPYDISKCILDYLLGESEQLGVVTPTMHESATPQLIMQVMSGIRGTTTLGSVLYTIIDLPDLSPTPRCRYLLIKSAILNSLLKHPEKFETISLYIEPISNELAIEYLFGRTTPAPTATIEPTPPTDTERVTEPFLHTI